MPKISVLTPTIRRHLGSLTPIHESLSEQTTLDFEWLIDEGDGKTYDLNKAYNRMLRRAKGELIVFAEDFMRFLPTGLESFWIAYRRDVGPGRKMRSRFFTAPTGKVSSFSGTEEPRWDQRKTSDKCEWPCWEIDWGAAPLSALVEIGGFDEKMDRCWANGNVNLAFRAHQDGWKFACLPDNPAIILDHDAIWPHPFRKDFDPAFLQKRIEDFKSGERLTLWGL